MSTGHQTRHDSTCPQPQRCHGEGDRDRRSPGGSWVAILEYTLQTTQEFVASEMAQNIEAFSSKLDDLCLIPGDHR